MGDYQPGCPCSICDDDYMMNTRITRMTVTEWIAHRLRRLAHRLHNPDHMSRIVLRHTDSGEELAWVHVLGDCCGHGVVSAWMVDTPIPGVPVTLCWEDDGDGTDRIADAVIRELPPQLAAWAQMCVESGDMTPAAQHALHNMLRKP